MLALRCALDDQSADDETASVGQDGDQLPSTLAEVRDRVIDHLVAWAEDGEDITESRVSAIAALRILRDRVPLEHRGPVHRRLLAVADDPNLSASDLINQASTHPLSRFSFHTGSEHFAADALLGAAYFVTSRAEATAIAERLSPALALGWTNESDGQLRALTLREIDEHDPQPLGGLAHHPAPVIRAVVAQIWARHGGAPSSIIVDLSQDPQARVRRAAALALAGLDESIRGSHAGLLEQLAEDPSHLVRSAIVSSTA